MGQVMRKYIPTVYSEEERLTYLWGLEFRSWLRPRAGSRRRVRFARDEIIDSLRSELNFVAIAWISNTQSN